MNPEDFVIRDRYFPFTQEEKEKSSREIISMFNLIPLTDEMEIISFVGNLPNGTTIFLVRGQDGI